MLRIDAVKSLQQRWQAEAQTVPLDRKQEQKLWDAFRKPIDEAFNRKTQEREKAAAAMSGRDRAVLEASRAFVTVEHPHGSTEWMLIGFAVALGAVGLVLGFRRTMASAIVPAREAPESTGLARVLEKRYFVDEIYDAAIVRPVQWFSRVVLWKVVDQALVDGIAVRGSARLLEGIGWLGSRLQTGQVGLYLLLFVAGAVWVLGFMLGV